MGHPGKVNEFRSRDGPEPRRLAPEHVGLIAAPTDAYPCRGNVLLVWRLDRLGRSVRHLVTLIDQLQEMGVGFRSVCDGAIDTTTPSGELIFHVFSALAQFERRLIQSAPRRELPLHGPHPGEIGQQTGS